jgi:hypothetical protein
MTRVWRIILHLGGRVKSEILSVHSASRLKEFHEYMKVRILAVNEKTTQLTGPVVDRRDMNAKGWQAAEVWLS